MNWTAKVKKEGYIMHSSSGQLPDPIWDLGAQAKSENMPKAVVEARVAHWGEHVSVSFGVSLECPQTEGHMQVAAECAATAATRFVNELVSRFDNTMPMLPTQRG